MAPATPGSTISIIGSNETPSTVNLVESPQRCYQRVLPVIVARRNAIQPAVSGARRKGRRFQSLDLSMMWI